jgi:hypothetical protein
VAGRAGGAPSLQREVSAELLGGSASALTSTAGLEAGLVAPAGSVAADPPVPGQGGRDGAAGSWAAAGVGAPPAAGLAGSPGPDRLAGALVQRQVADAAGRPRPLAGAGAALPLLGDRPATPAVSAASGSASGAAGGSQSPAGSTGSVGDAVLAADRGDQAVGPVVARLPAVPLLGSGHRPSIGLLTSVLPDAGLGWAAPAGSAATGAAPAAAGGLEPGRAAVPAALQRAAGSPSGRAAVPTALQRATGTLPVLPGLSNRTGGAAGTAGGPGSPAPALPLPVPPPPAAAPVVDAGAIAVAAGLAHRETDGTVVFRQVADDVAAPAAVQSIVDSQAAAPVQRVEPATGPAVGGAAPSGAEVDELVRRLYEPLSARIKAELRLDRERAGMLTDLRR